MPPIPKFNGTCILNELMEFGSFPAGTQRYIRRALDIALGRRDAVVCWSRSDAESATIGEHYRAYARLDTLRALVPHDYDVEAMTRLMGPLVALSAFDLGQGRLNSFAPYRFLYERLLGAGVRPWLPAAYCAASTLPHLHPDMRRALLESIGDDAVSAVGWSPRHPRFVPEWVDKVDATTPA
jgi:hypothetical protein